MLSSLTKGMKDGALGLALKSFLNERLKEYGEALECQVDTKACRVAVKARLKGESEPVTVAVERYELEKIGDERYITLKTFSCSKEWVALLLGNFLKDKRYKLPAAVASFL